MWRRLSWVLGLMLLAGALPAAAQTAYSVRSDGGSAAGSLDDYLYSINLATGEARAIGPTGFEDVESLAFSPGCGRLFGVDDVTDQLLTCDLETGDCTAVGPLKVDVTDTGLAFSRNGLLTMSTDAPKKPTNIYHLNPYTGEAARVGDQGQSITGLAVNDTAIYGLGGDNSNNLVMIDSYNGHATPVGSLGSAVKLSDGGLDFAADGQLYGISDASGRTGPSQVFTVDTATGHATVVATVHDDKGKPINGFEGLAVQDGICSGIAPGGIVTEVPTASEWGLAILTAMLVAAGIFILRRG